MGMLKAASRATALLVAMFALFVFKHTLLINIALDRDGVFAVGTIVEISPGLGTGAKVAFAPVGQNEMTASVHMPHHFGAGIKAGDRVRIVYDRTRPRIVAPAAWPGDSTTLVFFGALGLAGLLPTVLWLVSQFSSAGHVGSWKPRTPLRPVGPFAYCLIILLVAFSHFLIAFDTLGDRSSAHEGQLVAIAKIATINNGVARAAFTTNVGVEVMADVALPKRVEGRVAAGDDIFVTYTVGDAAEAYYGLGSEKNGGWSEAALFSALLAAAAWLAWSAWRVSRMSGSRGLDSEEKQRAVVFGLGAFALATIVTLLAKHEIGFELGMMNRGEAASTVTRFELRGNRPLASYTIAFPDGVVSRTRDFLPYEIELPSQIAVGRSFTTVYVEGDRGKNRPEWVEVVHAENRKMRAAIAVTSLVLALLATIWCAIALIGPGAPPPSSSRNLTRARLGLPVR